MSDSDSSSQYGVSALKEAATSLEAVRNKFAVPSDADAVNQEYRMRIPTYYLGLIEKEGDPIWLQSVPDARELDDDNLPEDPLAEDKPENSPVPHLTHRYPDRVLLLVTDRCPMYCRYCTRKRKTLKGSGVGSETIQQGIDYIAAHPEVRDVIISGGDPLMLSDEKLRSILARLRAIPHVQILRVHSRMPCVQPQRVTKELAEMIGSFKPVFMNVHFNHPREVTDEAKRALDLLADAGIPLGNQTVLLRGVNDDPKVMMELNHKLLMCRVKPYYLYQADMVKSTDHLRTRVEDGIAIIQALRGWTSGLAVPQYVIDGPDGGGKIPIVPQYLQKLDSDEVILQNYQGRRIVYQQPPVPTRAEVTGENGVLLPGQIIEHSGKNGSNGTNGKSNGKALPILDQYEFAMSDGCCDE
jgi:lysine 2,3-aminomutase